MADIDEHEELAVPVETILSADQVRMRHFAVDAEAQQLILLVSKGVVDGDGFHETLRDSITLTDEFDDEGNPVSSAYSNAMANTELAEMIRAAPTAVSFGRILRQVGTMIMKAKGMVN